MQNLCSSFLTPTVTTAQISPSGKSTRVVSGFLFLFAISALLPSASSLVHFTGEGFAYTFLDAPARFAVPINAEGICGSIHVANPIDACSSLRNAKAKIALGAGNDDDDSKMRIVLAMRGNCSFEMKVRVAQDAGFQAVIVYNDQDKNSLVSMIGNSEGIYIHAIFVSKMAGETLKKYARGDDGECCIGLSSEETAGTVLVISLISLVIILSVLATFFFARNCRRIRNVAQNSPQTMAKDEVDILPSFIFKAANLRRKSMSETCAICLEDYRDEEILRLLPCEHAFHSVCIDYWLTKWGTFCPVCKHEMTSGN